MADDWESAADSEIILQNAASTVNKWEGEDDDDDVKESWEDEEEKKDEENEKPTITDVPVKTKPSKALKAKLEEQARLEEEKEAKRLASLTPEEKLAEKLRLQKIQEDSDLNHALDTFGVTRAETNGNGLDSFNPETKEQFKEFGSALSWKVGQYRESAEFPQFVEDLVRGLCIHLSAADIKKVKMSVEILHSEKLKMEKAIAKKAAGKNKGKATLRTESDDIDDYKKYGNDFSEDYDDFM
ncbi:GL16765 [Drosophila persimilis]|uniref:Eukaryotic translation initiation factor 3 subunit J n=3 Tax=pseudoobscura subgroup TaxID=32358 RepID=EIF3J_DROPS|nr:eukaryotic translation initiation factor 3 subunit J [Drosophila pseudoobscura]XP_002018433.1 eukaryotic translation initiation factor 3 subunit J [Drosophila persimilis]B4GIF2.1 RecName: Full=Eukaryotic translation initiation factor 3 subunit J; Short=eIF3j [Drosophila persimilis]Q8I1E5.1 RecName: Full=Eukaryotic translation initiation factor 3 subunit J; Short=eIF3j [Drosophila pseudoobscura pseudoobscura]AAO01025.1 Adam-PA [Drosophila pseudoobscura]EDW36272.1 GL16765 [Drosophila persimil